MSMSWVTGSVSTWSNLLSNRWVIVDIDGVDAIIGLVGEVNDAAVDNRRGTSIFVYSISCAVPIGKYLSSTVCINDDTASVLGIVLQVINGLSDRIDQDVAKHDILL